MGSLYRLVTRHDFDGLVCAVLLKSLGIIDDIHFVHPKDVQDGNVPLDRGDITTNLPYSPYVYTCFDHHASEVLRTQKIASNHIIDPHAPSAARVVYNHFGGKEKFPHSFEEMLTAVDKADSAQFSIEEILHPEKWVLFNYVLDPRTGLERFRNFRIGSYELVQKLIPLCMEKTIDEILLDPDVKERIDMYFTYEEIAKEQLQNCAVVHENLVELDLRYEETIWPINRFMLYALFPQCNISNHIIWGAHPNTVVFAVGKSILNRTSSVSIGELMLAYGGGGHTNAGTCQIPAERTQEMLKELRTLLSEK